MKVSKEEILHIADLAHLNLEEDKVEQYLLNLEDILNFAEVVNKQNVEGLDVTIGMNENSNVFRKDEVKENLDRALLISNAAETKDGMLRVQQLLEEAYMNKGLSREDAA